MKEDVQPQRRYGRGLQSPPRSNRSLTEPHGEVTLAQLNRFLGACLYQESPMLSEGASYDDIAFALAVKRTQHLTTDPLYKMLQEELAKHLTPAQVEDTEGELPELRQWIAYGLQRALALPRIPETWNEMHERGIEGQAAFMASVDEHYPNQPAMLNVLSSCFGQIWYRLEEQAFRGEKEFKRGIAQKRRDEQISVKQFNTMKQVTAEDFLPSIRRLMGNYLQDISGGFNKQDQMDFIAEMCTQYLEGQLARPEVKGAWPETWREFNQRIMEGRERWLPTVENLSQRYDINLIGHEKELEQVYDAAAQHLVHIGRQCVVDVPAWH